MPTSAWTMQTRSMPKCKRALDTGLARQPRTDPSGTLPILQMPSDPLRILRATMARESDPTAMLGLVVLVIVAELLAIAVGVTFGMFIG